MAKTAVKMNAASSRSIYNNYNSGTGAAQPLQREYIPAPQIEPLDRPARKAKHKALPVVRPAERIAPLAVIGMVAAAVLAVMILCERVRLNSLNNEIIRTQSELSVLEQNGSNLKDEYQQTFDMSDIEKDMQAGGKMITPNDSQMVYLELSEPDSAETFEATSGILYKIRTTLNMVIDFFR